MENINILVTSSGRRTKLLEYFKRTFNGIGKLVVTDMSSIAPTIYFADKHYLVPNICDENYFDIICDIIKKENIKGVFSLIDPELSMLSENEDKILSLGAKAIVSPKAVCDICFDKYKMYKFCTENGINTVKTYLTIEDFEADYKLSKIDFPVFVKPKCGSASIGINKVYNIDELKLIISQNDNLIIQELMRGQEYGVDVYTDLISKKIVSIFIKKKLVMRAGETDKAVSYKNEKLFEMVKAFIEKLGTLGQADIDIFEKDGEFYISEVNPRFGGGYPIAFECGCNFPKYILNNLMGIENNPEIGNYEAGIYMMKYDDVLIKKENELLH